MPKNMIFRNRIYQKQIKTSHFKRKICSHINFINLLTIDLISYEQLIEEIYKKYYLLESMLNEHLLNIWSTYNPKLLLYM